MIRVADSLKLAYTKIRTRKIRLFVTVFVSSLLFAGLAAGSIIFSGATQSIESFSSEGFSKRYMIAGAFQDASSYSNNIWQDPAIIARAEQLEKTDLENRKAAAKRLGIEYQQKDEEKAVYSNADGTKSLNLSSKNSLKAVEESESRKPKIDLERFKTQLNTPAQAYYQIRRIESVGYLTEKPIIKALNNGKETYAQALGQNNTMLPPGYTKGIAGISDGWTLMDRDLMKPFIIPGQSLERSNDGVIPIVISYSAAQEILKLPELNSSTPNAQKKDRLATVRRDIAGKAFEVCYRNASASTLLTMAIQQQADFKENGKNKDYQKPELMYGLPTSPCTEPVIERDVRTADTKKAAAKQQEFDREFGAQDPKTEMLHFRIVGVTPDRTLSMGMPTVQDAITMMTGSTLGATWVSPLDAMNESVAVQDIFRLSTGISFEPQQYFVAEYNDAAVARSLLKNNTCVMEYPGSVLQASQVACSRESRPFTLQSFGSASLALDDIKSGFRNIQIIAAAIITAIASIVLMGMIGRIIADSRKETAVFRALGASRFSIAQIYGTYTVYLAALIALSTGILGLGVALWVDAMFSSEVSITMALMFNVADLSKQAHFYGFDLFDLGFITAATLLASFVGAIVPIAHNIQRNPITDMREE